MQVLANHRISDSLNCYDQDCGGSRTSLACSSVATGPGKCEREFFLQDNCHLVPETREVRSAISPRFGFCLSRFTPGLADPGCHAARLGRSSLPLGVIMLTELPGPIFRYGPPGRFRVAQAVFAAATAVAMRRG
ncbi:hypothetical protein CB1_001320003 [Camelus ferus]|nr:hypothetical protein CB1_001320003 [Camelus ferus]